MMTEPIWYALKHKSGIFMPDFKGRAGGTYIDPFVDNKRPPRLFTTKLAAHNALSWWLDGKFTRQTVGDPFSDEGESVVEKTRKVEGRIAEDWKIVPVQVRLAHIQEFLSGKHSSHRR